MESIVSKERFLACPLCETPISSNSPICERCGLEISAKGIDELARTEEARITALEDAVSLNMIARLFLAYSGIAYFISTGEGYSTLILLMFWVSGCVIFLLKLFQWHQNHSQIYFELDILREAKKEKNLAVATYLICWIVGILFLLKNLHL